MTKMLMGIFMKMAMGRYEALGRDQNLAQVGVSCEEVDDRVVGQLMGRLAEDAPQALDLPADRRQLRHGLFWLRRTAVITFPLHPVCKQGSPCVAEEEEDEDGLHLRLRG